MQLRLLAVAMSAAGLLAACGGGGGGSDEPSSSSLTVSGVASKGLMDNATVEILAVNGDGTVGSVLATGDTNARGEYSLPLKATAGQPYVVRVKAKAGGKTKHRDEVTGVEQPLPADFQMRALLIPSGDGTTEAANVTPFSELAVAAAANAKRGITKANAEQATATVRQMLGFDPVKVSPTIAAEGSPSAESVQLKALLTAVSQLANDGALGCQQADPGEKTKCVVDELAGAATVDSKSLGTEVSGALKDAVTTVLAKPEFTGNEALKAQLGRVTDTVSCTVECDAAPASDLDAVDAAKKLLSQVRSDWQDMFVPGGIAQTATSTANSEAFLFRRAMQDVQVPANVLVQDLSAILMGVDLYNEMKAGRSSEFVRYSRVEGLLDVDPNWVAPMACQLYADIDATIPATTRESVVSIGCAATYHVEWDERFDENGQYYYYVNPQRWRHGFTIRPSANGAFHYYSRARFGDANLTNRYEGDINVTLDGTGGVVAGFSVAGKLPYVIEFGSTNASAYHEWSVSGSRTGVGSFDQTMSVEGWIKGYDANNAVLGTLSVLSAKLSTVAVTEDGSRLTTNGPIASNDLVDSAELHVKWTTAAAEFQGELSAGASQWDRSGTALMPTTAKLSGTLRNIANNVKRDFITGTLEASVKGYESFDATQPPSASNTYAAGATFIGSVTAPSRPRLQVRMDTGSRAHEDLSHASLVYSVFDTGSTRPRTEVRVEADRTAAGTAYTITEPTSKLSMTVVPGGDKATLMYDGKRTIGELDTDRGLMTYIDGSFESVAGSF